MGDCDGAGLFAARHRSLPRSRHPGKQVEDRADIGPDCDQASISCTRHARARRRNRAICRGPDTPADLGTEYDRGAAYLSWLAASARLYRVAALCGLWGGPKIVFRRIRDRLKATLGLPVLVTPGPSYLHTIGQVYQGGPAKGLFLLLTASPANDLAIPGADYSFGQLQLALAQGDFESLGRRRRPVIRLHLSCGAEQGLIQLETILNNALRKRHFAAP